MNRDKNILNFQNVDTKKAETETLLMMSSAVSITFPILNDVRNLQEHELQNDVATESSSSSLFLSFHPTCSLIFLKSSDQKDERIVDRKGKNKRATIEKKFIDCQL